MNITALTGRFTKQPEVKTTNSGKSVCSFCIAVNRSYGDTTDFIDCVAWEKTAEFIGKYFNKGSKIEIEGEINTRDYTDSNGVKRKVTEVKVSQAGFAESKKAEGAKPNLDVAPPADDFEEIVDDEDNLPF